jgi:hypothetical protein
MNKHSNSWGKYLLAAAFGVFIVLGISSPYVLAVSNGQEPGSGVTGAASSSDTAPPDPYIPELKDVFFDRGSFDIIREDAKPVLDENVQALRNEPDTFVVIESYCDAREESSASLGASRGESVKEYMVSRGADADQILTVNKCTVDDMQHADGYETVRLDSRVHFVILDQPKERDQLAMSR